MKTINAATPKVPANEVGRQAELDLLGILDSLPEQEYDDITRLAAEICHTPISLISLIDNDRQWFMSKQGIDAGQTPRDLSFCAHAINAPGEIFIVPDSRQDIRFANNPLVTGAPHVIFYAGVPLVTHSGNALGTLCIVDNKPGKLSEGQIESLKALANKVVRLFELKRSNAELEKSKAELALKNEELQKFAYTMSHDIKAPISNINIAATILKEEFIGKLSDESNNMLDYLINSSAKAKSMIDAILAYHMSDELLDQKTETNELNLLLKTIAEFITINENIEFNYPENNPIITINRIAFEQVIINLTNNAIKYNDKSTIVIDYGFREDNTHYYFSVTDNGRGIPANQLGKIFNLFATLDTTDRYGSKGTGIGLSTVKKLVNRMGGEITVTSTEGVGTTFTFSIKK